MKKLIFALSLALFLFSCDNGGVENKKANPFVGTWENETGLRYIFTATNVQQLTDEKVYWSGTYTYNETNLTVTTNYRDSDFQNLEMYPNPFVFSYRFENDILIIGGLFAGRKIPQ